LKLRRVQGLELRAHRVEGVEFTVLDLAKGLGFTVFGFRV
jgi:hypothetical protein